MCFQFDVRSAQAEKFVKYSIIIKVIYFVLSVDKFEQKYVVLKVMLQSPSLKDHVKTIGIGQ